MSTQKYLPTGDHDLTTAELESALAQLSQEDQERIHRIADALVGKVKLESIRRGGITAVQFSKGNALEVLSKLGMFMNGKLIVR